MAFLRPQLITLVERGRQDRFAEFVAFRFLVDAREQLGRLAQVKFCVGLVHEHHYLTATLKVCMSDEKLLARAAQAYGIELRYTDTWGRVHEASPEILRALLVSLGFAAGSDEQICERALAERELARRSRAVRSRRWWCSKSRSLPLRIPAAARRGVDQARIPNGKNGELEHHWFWMPELRTLERFSVDGEELMAKRVPLPGRCGWAITTCALIWMQEPELETFADARFIVCPRRAKVVERRGAGLAVSLYGLRSARNWGCGDFTDLEAVIDASLRRARRLWR